MKEIEILVEVDESFESAAAKLSGFKMSGIKSVNDTYYFDPLRSDLKAGLDGRLTRSCRLRRDKACDSNSRLAYKIDYFGDNGIWKYSDECEFNVGSSVNAALFLQQLGLEELINIVAEKHIFLAENFEIVLEKVEGLGAFLEVELIGGAEGSVDDEINRIRDFIDRLGIRTGKELNMGKPELALRKRKM